MHLSDHPAATDRTAIFPGAGTGSLSALAYCALGLAGESSEVLEKVHQSSTTDGLVGELGDTAWYASRLCRELGIAPAPIPLPNDPYPAEVQLVISCGRVAEIVKKALRGDDGGALSDARRELLSSEVGSVWAAWLAVHARYGLDPEVTLAANVAKLTGRKERNLLHGDGDTR